MQITQSTQNKIDSAGLKFVELVGKKMEIAEYMNPSTKFHINHNKNVDETEALVNYGEFFSKMTLPFVESTFKNLNVKKNDKLLYISDSNHNGKIMGTFPDNYDAVHFTVEGKIKPELYSEILGKIGHETKEYLGTITNLGYPIRTGINMTDTKLVPIGVNLSLLMDKIKNDATSLEFGNYSVQKVKKSEDESHFHIYKKFRADKKIGTLYGYKNDKKHHMFIEDSEKFKQELEGQLDKDSINYLASNLLSRTIRLRSSALDRKNIRVAYKGLDLMIKKDADSVYNIYTMQ